VTRARPSGRQSIANHETYEVRKYKARAATIKLREGGKQENNGRCKEDLNPDSVAGESDTRARGGGEPMERIDSKGKRIIRTIRAAQVTIVESLTTMQK